MHRPPGWDAYKGAHDALRDNNPWFEDEHTACYEAGADAMLEALRGDKSLYNLGEVTGTWVFIPDEIEEGGDY